MQLTDVDVVVGCLVLENLILKLFDLVPLLLSQCFHLLVLSSELLILFMKGLDLHLEFLKIGAHSHSVGRHRSLLIRLGERTLRILGLIACRIVTEGGWQGSKYWGLIELDLLDLWLRELLGRWCLW